MSRACVIGWPIAHSRSPLIHGSWLNEHGIDGSYSAEAVRPEDLERFIASMPERGYVGGNLTVPHKRAALEMVAEADAAAQAVGAVNTLFWRDGQLIGTNTDAEGFLTHLDRSAPGWRDRCQTAVVLGAGGAARAVLYGLLESAVPEVRLANRTGEKAAELADEFGNAVHTVDWTERSAALAGADLLVNTTTLGMVGSAPLDIALDDLPPGSIVYDLVYVPLRTQLLATAAANGQHCVDGLGMLLHQAVPGFEAWFGKRPEVTKELRSMIIADLEKDAA